MMMIVPAMCTLLTLAQIEAQDARTNAANPAISAPPSDTLTLEEKQHLAAAREKAILAYPKLLQEEQKMDDEAKMLRSRESAITFRQIAAEAISHRKELEADMIEIDPTVGPVIAKARAIEAQRKSLLQRQFQAIDRQLKEALKPPPSQPPLVPSPATQSSH